MATKTEMVQKEPLTGFMLGHFVSVWNELKGYDDNMWDDVYEWDIQTYMERFSIGPRVATALYVTVQLVVFGRVV